MCADVSSAGYKYLASVMKKEEEPGAEQKAEDAFMLQLDNLEGVMSKHAGPYLVGYVNNGCCVSPSLCSPRW